MVEFTNVKFPFPLELSPRKSSWMSTDPRASLLSATTPAPLTSSTSTTGVLSSWPAPFPWASRTSPHSTSSGTRTRRWSTTTQREPWRWAGTLTGRRVSWPSWRPVPGTKATTPAAPATPGRQPSTSSSLEVATLTLSIWPSRQWQELGDQCDKYLVTLSDNYRSPVNQI